MSNAFSCMLLANVRNRRILKYKDQFVNMRVKVKWFVGILMTILVSKGFGQTDDEKYFQVITIRADKIVATLAIVDSTRYYQVRDVLVEQYSILNTHNEAREEAIKQIKEEFVGQKEVLENKRTAYEADQDKELRVVHNIFVDKLERLLDGSQIEAIKNGMTYGVLPLTYGAFQDMIPSLTNEQKAKILNYLTEARELAMDAPGSREKHAVFGKFKGRINNYLSAQGYDLQKEGDNWKARREQQTKNINP